MGSSASAAAITQRNPCIAEVFPMTTRCVNCEAYLDTERRYCDDACRKAWARRSDKTKPPKYVTEHVRDLWCPTHLSWFEQFRIGALNPAGEMEPGAWLGCCKQCDEERYDIEHECRRCGLNFRGPNNAECPGCLQ